MATGSAVYDRKAQKAGDMQLEPKGPKGMPLKQNRFTRTRMLPRQNTTLSPQQPIEDSTSSANGQLIDPMRPFLKILEKEFYVSNRLLAEIPKTLRMRASYTCLSKWSRRDLV